MDDHKLADLSGFKSVITAGGIGTRLLPFSKEIPKEMSPILVKDSNDTVLVKPIIQAIYEQLYISGVRDFFIVVGRGKRTIEDHFTPDLGFIELLRKRGKRVQELEEFYARLRSSNIVFVMQPEPLGFGDAVLRTKPYLDGEFLVHAGDTYIISNNHGYLDRLRKAHRKYSADATILLQDVEDPRQFGVVTGNEIEDGVIKVREAVEKPKRPISNTAIMPVYIFKNCIFNCLSRLEPDGSGEIQLTDALHSLASQGKTVVGVKLAKDDLRLDIGSPSTLIEALRLSSVNLER